MRSAADETPLRRLVPLVFLERAGSLRVRLGRIDVSQNPVVISAALVIGVGGSCGREGPIVQIGSAIGSVIGQWLGAPAAIMRTLVACGAAAGISATFNAPIGGVFFASEIILGEFAPRSFAAIVVVSVAAAVIGRAYLGNRPSFDAGAFTLVSPRELWLYALLGILCACWAAFFVRGLYWVEDRSTVLASLVGRRLVGGTVYELKLIRRGIDWARARWPGDLRHVRLASVVRTPNHVANVTDRIADVARSMGSSDELVVPVIDDGRLTGIVTASDLAVAVATGKGSQPDRPHLPAATRNATH
jgi:CBS domain-containing protein